MEATDRARVACSIFFLVNGAVVGTWVPFIPERAAALSLSAGHLGTVLLGGGVGAVLAMPLAGWLVPRLGSRRVSVAGALVFCTALLFVTEARTAWRLCAALVLFGLGGAGMDVAMNAQAVLVESTTGRRILSSLHGFYSLGNVAGSLVVSGLFAAGVEHRRIGASAASLLVVVVLATGRLMLQDEAQHRSGQAPARSFAPRLLWLGGLVVAAMISEGAIGDWSGVYLREVRRLGPGWAGVGFGIFAALMLVSRLLGDLVVARLGERRTLRLGGMVAMAGAVLVVAAPAASVSLFGFALLGAGLANASPVLYRAAGQVPGVPAGVGLATAVGMGYAGLLAGPPLLGGVAQLFGLRSIFVVLGALALLLSFLAGVGFVQRQPAS